MKRNWLAVSVLTLIGIAGPAHAVDVIWMDTPGGPQAINIGQGIGTDGGFDSSDWYKRFTLKSHKNGGSARQEDQYVIGAFSGTWQMGWNTTGLTSGTYSIIAYLEVTYNMGQTYNEVGQAGQGSQTLQVP